jgi:hypothetical protein
VRRRRGPAGSPQIDLPGSRRDRQVGATRDCIFASNVDNRDILTRDDHFDLAA